MVDFSLFDSILDSVFVVGSDGKVIYCNDPAANLCQSSVRRLMGKSNLSDLMTFTEAGILPFNETSLGRLSPTPFIETEFQLKKVAKNGKAQLAVRPVDEQHWLFYLRDVSLEEALHSKYRSELAQKEDYARNLEKLVEARTAELNKVNQTLNAILNSLGQGFFTFNAHGDCGDVYTRACAEILEGLPQNKKVWDVLAIPKHEASQFEQWMSSTFTEVLPFEDMKPLGPSLYPHSQKRHITLDYFPIRREADAIAEVVVVATDKTTEHQAQLALEAERLYAGMIVKFTKNKEQFLQFLASVKEALVVLQNMAVQAMSKNEMNESFRVLHTLEGEAGTFSLRELRLLARESQHLLEPFKGEEQLPQEARLIYLESIQKMASEYEAFLQANRDIFVLPKGQVSRMIEVPLHKMIDFLNQLESIPPAGALAQEIRENYLQVPIANCLNYFDSLIQSVAERLQKKVAPLKIEGGEIRIWPEPYQKLFASMVHAFRNAVDHGLETPEDREWSGKSPEGSIVVSVKQVAKGYQIVIRDDGKGIDPQIIRTKLTTKFPDQDFSKASDDEIVQQVCMPGFSSRDSVGEFSGRGVGLDALREEVLRLGGKIRIESKVVGQGTAIVLDIPLIGFGSQLLRSA